MYDLRRIKMSDIIRLGIDIRTLGRDSGCMEGAARELVKYLYNIFSDARTGENQCALVRFYKTHNNAELPSALRTYVDRQLSGTIPPKWFKSLVLLATAGDCPDWNSRYTSRKHQAIPLLNHEVVSRIPLICNMIEQMGMELDTVIRDDAVRLPELSKKTFNVSCIANAAESPLVLEQEDFVKPYGLKSILGFGGVLPSGNLFLVVMFTRVVVHEDTARLLNTLPLNVKLLLLPFVNDVFAGVT